MADSIGRTVLWVAVLRSGLAATTALSPGDVAIIGFNCDNPDEFGFVVLVDLEPATEVYFTDSGVTASGTFRGGEGAVKYTAPSQGTSSGTVLIYSSDHADFVSANDAHVGTRGLALSSSGDQIIVFQGSSASPSFIYAVNAEGDGWQSDAASSNQSALPPGLTAGWSALALNERDNGYYSGSTASGTRNELLEAIGQQDNWTTSNSRMNSTSWPAFFSVSSSTSTVTTVQFAASAAAVSEDTSRYSLWVTIANPSSSHQTTAEVVLTSGGTATNGSDISLYTPQTVTFSAGSSESQSVTITLVDDSEFEGPETLGFELENVSGDTGASVGSPAQFTLSIEDDDAPAVVINEILADPPSGPEGDANGDGIRDSGDDEFIELVSNHGSSVTLSGWTLSDGTGVRHTFPQGTALSRGKGLVVFGGGTPPESFGNSQAQTASEGALSLNNGGDSVILTAANGTTVASTKYGAEGGEDQSLTRDPDLTGPFVKHSQAQGSGDRLFSPGTKTNGHPFTGLTVEESSGGTAVTEGGESDTYGIVMESQPTATVSVVIDPDQQIEVAPSALTFSPDIYGETRWVTVTAVNDPDVEGHHTGTVTHTVTSDDTLYDHAVIDDITVAVTDNDVAGIPVTETGEVTEVSEGGASDTYSLVLNTRPGADVAINPVVSHGEVEVSPSALLFTSSNYATSQHISIVAVDDSLFEGTHTDRVHHEVTSNDSNYHGISIDTITVSVTDDDPSPVIINEIHYNPAVEQGADDEYEFLELFNRSGYTAYLSGYRFREGIELVFGGPDSLVPNAYLVVARSADAYPESIQWTAGSLANEGESLVVVTEEGTVVDSVRYKGVDPWPVEANGLGPSLELVNASMDNSLGEAWQKSFVDGGTPGAVNSANSAPQAMADSFSVHEDETLHVDPPGILENDTDGNGDPLTPFLVEVPGNGGLVLSSDGGFEYLPDPDYFGQDTFRYAVHDGADTSSAAIAALKVFPVNDAPGLTGVIYADSVPEDGGEQRVDLEGIHSGAFNEHQGLTLSARSGRVDLIPHPRVDYTSPDSAGALSYTPLPDKHGQATLAITVQDDGGKVDGGIDSTTVFFDVTVIPVNDPPRLSLAPVVMSEDSSDTLLLPAVDVDGDTLAYLNVVTDTSAITAALAGGESPPRLVLTAAGDWYGSGRVTMSVSDGKVEVDEGFDITVTPENDPPDAFSLVWPEDSAIIVITENLLTQSFIMAWESSQDRDGDSVAYDVTASGDVSFLTTGGIEESRLSLSYEQVVEAMGDSDRVDGDWSVVASDGQAVREADNGPFHVTLDRTTLAVAGPVAIPDAFALYPNVPNPFNPSTRIPYDVPHVSQVRIEVYDLLGRRIQVLASGIHPPGTYQELFRGMDDRGMPAASGIYVCRMVASEIGTGKRIYRKTRKLVLMK